MEPRMSRILPPSTLQPAILRLPEELLTLLVQAAIEVHADVTNGESIVLKTLRKVHRRFTFLRSLCRRLFRFVVYTPDPNREAAEDWTSIGTHVRELYLEPIIFPDPNLPWLNQEARDRNIQALQPYQQYIECGDGDTALIRALKALPNLQKTFIFSNIKDSQIAFPRADDFITFATRCLHRAAVKPEELEFRNVGIRELWDMSELARWIRSPVHQQLDLSGLRALTFELQNSTMSDDDSTNQRNFLTIARALQDILNRCKDNLEELLVLTRSVVVWYQPMVAPRMAKLNRLMLHDCRIEPTGLAEWILACDALTYVSLVSVFSRPSHGEEGLPSWQPLFSAVRNHARRMHVVLDGLEVNYPEIAPDDDLSVLEISFVHDTSGPASEPNDIRDLEYGGIMVMLKEYMSGIQEWHLPEGW